MLSANTTVFKIAYRDQPGNVIWLHYTPTEDVRRWEADWEEVEVPGRGEMTLQFKQGKPQTFTFEAFLTTWGVADDRSQRITGGGSGRKAQGVEDTITWLETAMKPKPGSEDEEPTPPILEVTTDRVFECVLVSMEARSVARASNEWQGPEKPNGSVRAYVSLEFRAYVPSTI